MKNEKQRVALYSVAAAGSIAVLKIAVGIATGSLGILSEAAHSTFDLGGAAVAFYALKISDKPADREHSYGHGKVENFGALLVTLMLLVTCGWIIYEAVYRMFFGGSVEIQGTYPGIAVMAVSIVVNMLTARLSGKAASKYGSQVLEANALHFSSDVWSSVVVIAGLACVTVGRYLGVKALDFGDPVAALGVSALVMFVSLKLGKRTIDVLLDTAPEGMANEILHEVNSVRGVLEVDNIRVRPSGPNYFIDFNIGIARQESHRVVHSIVHEAREKLKSRYPGSDIMISTFPVDVAGQNDNETYVTVKKIVDDFPNCTNIHNIHVYEAGGDKFIAVHIEVRENMSLSESHDLSHEIGGRIQKAIPGVKDVNVNFEFVNRKNIVAEDITDKRRDVIDFVDGIINDSHDGINCHDARVYSRDNRLTLFLHCGFGENHTTEKIESITKSITEKIRNGVPDVESVHIHVEPMH